MKAGWKTSEFWLVVLLIAAAVWLRSEVVMTATVAPAFGYLRDRRMLKMGDASDASLPAAAPAGDPGAPQ